MAKKLMETYKHTNIQTYGLPLVVLSAALQQNIRSYVLVDGSFKNVSSTIAVMDSVPLSNLKSIGVKYSSLVVGGGAVDTMSQTRALFLIFASQGMIRILMIGICIT